MEEILENEKKFKRLEKFITGGEKIWVQMYKSFNRPIKFNLFFEKPSDWWEDKSSWQFFDNLHSVLISNNEDLIKLKEELVENKLIKGDDMKNEIMYERGFINIVPTNEQFEKSKTGEINLKDLKAEDKIEKIKTKDGKEFEKAKIKIVNINEGNIKSGKAVIFTNKEEIEKIKIYEENKTPVKIVSVLEKTEKGEYKRGIAIEDGRNIERIKDTLENKKEQNPQKKIKQEKESEIQEY